MGSFIHKSACVQSNFIGENTKIWQNVVILEETIIGNNVNINCHCYIENNVKIGNNVTVKSGVYLWDGIILEDNVFIGPNVTFTNDVKPRSKQHDKIFDKTLIMRGASIGAGSTIIGGITVGLFSMIGAGSVVTKDIPNNTLWYGNPAKLKGYVCNCGDKLVNQNDALVCKQCDKSFQLINEEIKEK